MTKIFSTSQIKNYTNDTESLVDKIVKLIEDSLQISHWVKNGNPSAEDILIDNEAFKQVLNLVANLTEDELEKTIVNASWRLYDGSLDLMGMGFLDGNKLSEGLLEKIRLSLPQARKASPQELPQNTSPERELGKILAKAPEGPGKRDVLIKLEKNHIPGFEKINLKSGDFNWQEYFLNEGALETLDVLYEVAGERMYEESLAQDLKNLSFVNKLKLRVAKRFKMSNVLRRLTPSSELIVKNPNISEANRNRIKATITDKLKGSDWDPEKVLNALLSQVGLARIQKERIQRI